MDKFFTQVDKFLMAIIWFIPGMIIGCIIRLFSYPTVLSSLGDLAIQYSLWGLGGGIISGLLAFCFPKTSSFILEVLLGIEIGKNS